MDRNIKNKKIVIVGLSRSGYAAAILALKHKAKVYVTETSDNKALRQKAEILIKKKAFVELGGHTPDFFQSADFFITSPGVKNSSPAIVWAQKNKIKIYSEIEFASWFCKAPIIAITGSNGKTTVTTLVGKILKKAGKKVIVCGNIGNPFSGESSKFKNADFIVLEVSSFQLEYIKWFRPKMSIILNITQNHFDHHKDIKEYAMAKARVFENQNQNDYTVLNFNDKMVRKLAAGTKSKILYFSSLDRVKNQCIKKSYAQAYLEDGNINIYAKDKKIFNIARGKLKIKGTHNIENAMAAALATLSLGIKNDAVSAVFSSFKGLEHRCEKVARIKGVSFINDSKSTTVDATDKALSGFFDKSVILICGGRDKGSDFSVLGKRLKQKVLKVIAIGEAREKLIAAFSGFVPVLNADSLVQAVEVACGQAKSGQTIILSPMCASFDMFDNFEHRGSVFKQIVKGMGKQWI